MSAVNRVLGLLLCLSLAACGVSADRFPGTVVAPPMDLAGQWQLVGERNGGYALEPAASNHYSIKTDAGEPAGTLDVTIQLFQGTHYLVVADPSEDMHVRVFRILDVQPAAVRIVKLDPVKTEAVLRQHGMPVAKKKMWMHDEIVLTGADLATLLALPPENVFAMHDSLTLHRVQQAPS